MKKFESILNVIGDLLLFSFIIFVMLSLCVRCSSQQNADTIRIKERADETIQKLDSLKCKDKQCYAAIEQAKQLIKDSIDNIENKDEVIYEKEKEIQNNTIYTQTGKYVIWGSVILIILLLIYFFRTQIFELIKIVKPI